MQSGRRYIHVLANITEVSHAKEQLNLAVRSDALPFFPSSFYRRNVPRNLSALNTARKVVAFKHELNKLPIVCRPPPPLPLQYKLNM